MTNLTQEQVAKVASEVTDEKYSVHEHPGPPGILSEWFDPYVGVSDDPLDGWTPNFKGDSRDRSQALAVVEWLSENIKDIHQWWDIKDLVRTKDINALQKMVFELMEVSGE